MQNTININIFHNGEMYVVIIVVCYHLVPKLMLGSLMVEESNNPYLENVPIKANVLSVESLQWSQPFNPNM